MGGKKTKMTECCMPSQCEMYDVAILVGVSSFSNIGCETGFDSYILEGKELEFYMKKLQRKKGKGAAA